MINQTMDSSPQVKYLLECICGERSTFYAKRFDKIYMTCPKCHKQIIAHNAGRMFIFNTEFEKAVG